MAESNNNSMLNRFFHYADRGGTLGGEIAAGLGIFFLSACGIFINMQLIAKLTISGAYSTANISQIAANGEIYAQNYFVSMLLAFAGSLLIGLVARLPLVQTAGLGLSTVLVSMVGTGTGLTYYNLLAVCFFSAILYAAVVCIPGVNKALFNALPNPVRRALPAAAGLMMAWIAMQLTGLVSVNGSSLSIYGTGAVLEQASDSVALPGLVSFGSYSYATDKFHPLLLVCALSVAVTFAAWLLLRRSKRPYLFSLLTGTVFFLVVSICAVGIDWKTFNFSMDFLWGRLWMVGSEDAMHTHLSPVLSNLNLGRVFSEGLDFSAYTENGGSVPMLLVTGVLTFLAVYLFDAEATLRCVADSTGAFSADGQEGVRLAMACNAGMNILAPLAGGAPVSISKTSCAGAEDGARSGLASVVASIGFFISAFVWIVPFLFATITSYDITFNLYGHYGAVLQLLCECSFAVADTVMVIVGLSMITRAARLDWTNTMESIPFTVTVAAAFFLSNLACGAAAGIVAYLLLCAGARGEKPSPVQLIGGAFSLVLLVLNAVW